MQKPTSSLRQSLRHFTLGSVLGAVSGLLIWLMATPSSHTDRISGLACVLTMSLICGLLAGWKREKFWENTVGWLFMW